jgi:hypothetical protein
MGALITADPKAATFCGEILKFATAPYRAGRQLDSAIDEFVELMKAKGERPQGDDPTTAMGKVQLQIEQLKQATAAQKNAQDLQIAQAKLAQEDQHHQKELQLKAAVEAGKLNASAGDDQAKAQVQNQKLMENREAHQAHMLENSQKMELDRQKAGLAVQQHALRANDMQAKQQERQSMQAFKQQRPI